MKWSITMLPKGGICVWSSTLMRGLLLLYWCLYDIFTRLGCSFRTKRTIRELNVLRSGK
jgi:hypothetical protein